VAADIQMLLNMTDDADYLRDAPSSEEGNGETSYAIDPNYVWRLPNLSAHFSDGTYQHDISGNTVLPGAEHDAEHRRDYVPLTKEEQCRIGPDGEVIWAGRNPLSNCGNIATEVLEGYTAAHIYLYDFDSWEILGTEMLAGRECVSIRGHLNKEHCESVSGGVTDLDLFCFFVDAQTGVIMKLLNFRSDGTLSAFLVVDRIAFDEEAEPVQMVDLSGMEHVEPMQ
jgi:hypothetical protein